MEGTYKIADTVIRISSLYSSVHSLCEDYRTDEPVDIGISISESDIVYEREKSAAEDRFEGHPVTPYPPDYLETLAVYRKIACRLVSRNTLFFHGSAIAVDGKCCIFTAKSGTGKSTHTALWRKKYGERCVMINDDKPLITVNDKGITVFGTPWNGKHRLGENTSAELKAICLLERDTTNHIEKVSFFEILPFIVSQTFRPADAGLAAATMQLIRELGNRCEFYRLGCNMEDEAAEVSFNGMHLKE